MTIATSGKAHDNSLHFHKLPRRIALYYQHGNFILNVEQHRVIVYNTNIDINTQAHENDRIYKVGGMLRFSGADANRVFIIKIFLRAQGAKNQRNL